MKVGSKNLVDRVCLSFLIMLTLAAVECRGAEKERDFVPIRIGWQMPAATQGQIIQVLKRTNVLEAHGLDPSLIPFSYGGPQVEAAFAGELDVVFSGDQPAINLIARGGKWKIVARLYDDRVATIIPTSSTIRDLRDLRGRTVASALGSVGHRHAVLQQLAAGLDPDLDVINKDVDILDISNRVLAGGVESWGEIDAAVVWEPLLSRFRLKGLVRVLTSEPSLGVVSMSDNFITNHPEAAAQFLVALMRAWEFLARYPDRVMRWYIEDTQLDYKPEELISARLDPNFSAAALSEIDMTLKAGHIATLEQGAAWGRTVSPGDHWTLGSVNQSLLARAQQIISEDTFDDIEIVLPSEQSASLISNEYSRLFDSVPIGAVYAFMVLIALLAIEFGLWLGKRGKKHLDDPSLQPIATVVGAVLGMMAFVIALTFSSANARFDERKSALLADVTAIQTAYLRASLLPEPHRTTVRSLLRDYVHMRVGIVYAYGQPERLELVQRRAVSLQRLMWAHVEALSDTPSDSRIQLLFATALNDVFKMHTKRVVLGAYYQIPVFVWIALLVASTLAMFAVGYQFGASGGRRILVAKLALSLTFALVMLLAIDLDRTGEGLIAVNQQPMLNLYQSMNAG